MKNLKPLSKAEMKKVIGGEDPLCPAGLCYDASLNQCVPGEDCGGDYPKIEACVGKHEGDSCFYSLPGSGGHEGYCRVYLASPLFCSTLI